MNTYALTSTIAWSCVGYSPHRNAACAAAWKPAEHLLQHPSYIERLASDVKKGRCEATKRNSLTRLCTDGAGRKHVWLEQKRNGKLHRVYD